MVIIIEVVGLKTYWERNPRTTGMSRSFMLVGVKVYWVEVY